MAKISSLFAALLLLVALSNHFANCFGNIGSEISDTKPGCTGNNCEVPKPCVCHKPVKKCEDFFSTMNRYKYLQMKNRIIRSKDRSAYTAFDACLKMFLPPKVAAAYKSCNKKIVGEYEGLTHFDALAEQPILILGVYDCITEGDASDLTPEEKTQVLAYEKCVEKIKPVCVKND